MSVEGEGGWKAPLDFGNKRKTARLSRAIWKSPGTCSSVSAVLRLAGASVLTAREASGALPSDCVGCIWVTFPLALQPLRGASQSGPWSAPGSPARAPCSLAPGCVGLFPQERVTVVPWAASGPVHCSCPRPPHLLEQQQPPERPVKWLSIHCAQMHVVAPQPRPRVEAQSTE